MQTGWLHKDNPNCTDAVAAYVMGDLNRTLCSLTKAFLFKSTGGKLPGTHSLRMNFCPSGEEDVNKEHRPDEDRGGWKSPAKIHCVL